MRETLKNCPIWQASSLPPEIKKCGSCDYQDWTSCKYIEIIKKFGYQVIKIKTNKNNKEKIIIINNEDIDLWN
jgi:hypothetical protein